MKKKNLYKKGLILKPLIIAAFIIAAGAAALASSSDDAEKEEFVISQETGSARDPAERSKQNSAEDKDISSDVLKLQKADAADTFVTMSEIPSDDHPVVYICGEVRNPGLYKCKNDSRIADAVEQAGGLLPEADDTCINMAARVEDAQQIIITKRGETHVAADGNTMTGKGSGAVSSDTFAQGGGLVNINTADEAALKTLPGIGEQKAKAIINYRQSGGRFSKIEDIMNVSGIKDGAFNKIKDLITV